jgi:hypothetical protein
MLIETLRKLDLRLRDIKPTAKPLAIQAAVRDLLPDIASVHKAITDKVMRKRIATFHNKTDSLLGGLQSTDYSRDDALAYAAKARAFIKEIAKSVTTKTQAKAANKTGTFSSLDEWRTSVEAATPAEEESADPLDQFLKDTPTVIKRYSSLASVVATLQSRNLLVARLPVVPIMNPALERTRLEKMGIPYEQIGPYVVLEDQLVLGFNTQHIKSVMETMRKTPSFKLTKRGHKRSFIPSTEDARDYLLQTTLDHLKATTRREYQVVGNPIQRGPGAFFWLTTDKFLTLLGKATFGGHGHLKIKSWGFAFHVEGEVERHKVPEHEGTGADDWMRRNEAIQQQTKIAQDKKAWQTKNTLTRVKKTVHPVILIHRGDIIQFYVPGKDAMVPGVVGTQENNGQRWYIMTNGPESAAHQLVPQSYIYNLDQKDKETWAKLEGWKGKNNVRLDAWIDQIIMRRGAAPAPQSDLEKEFSHE